MRSSNRDHSRSGDAWEDRVRVVITKPSTTVALQNTRFGQVNPADLVVSCQERFARLAKNMATKVMRLYKDGTLCETGGDKFCRPVVDRAHASKVWYAKSLVKITGTKGVPQILANRDIRQAKLYGAFNCTVLLDGFWSNKEGIENKPEHHVVHVCISIPSSSKHIKRGYQTRKFIACVNDLVAPQ